MKLYLLNVNGLLVAKYLPLEIANYNSCKQKPKIETNKE